jgi:RNA polymerase sigma-70 factor (ECF subfamily)
MHESESAVLAEAQEGSADAYRMLVESNSRRLFRLAFRITGNEQDAEDVVQETLLRAYKQLHRFEARASVATWLYRIAANCSLDLVRDRKRRQESAATRMEYTETTDDPAPDRLAISNQVQQCVTEAMDQLSHQERAAFVLRHFEGQSIEEISAALGLSASSAKQSIFRAVQKLRRVLEPVVGRTS